MVDRAHPGLAEAGGEVELGRGDGDGALSVLPIELLKLWDGAVPDVRGRLIVEQRIRNAERR